MKYIVIICCLILATLSFAQPGEDVGPLTGNPVLLAKSKQQTALAKSSHTFDSTFIYISDTIDLPVFDDFSSDKFQKYIEDYNAPGVTSVLEYRLLDLSSQPLPNNFVGTQQQTFRITYNEQTGVATNTNFTPVDVQLGDQTNYPTSYNTVSAYPPYYIYDTILQAGGTDPNPDTVYIIGPELTQDSARQFFMPVNDPNAIWEDSYVYLNNTMALNPWSIGVATFDGLDETGYPYAINSTLTNYADYLTSKPIDMSTVTVADSMYFSFMYQAQGLADPPEPGDSLVLQFYASALDQWRNVWAINGVAVDTFRAGHILIDDLDYFTDAFQFRFVNYGGLSGSLDHFHIDYVNLRSVPGFGGSADSLLRDIAFSYPLNTLLQDYTSVPWDHYKNLATPNNVMSANVPITMANSFPTDISANDGTLEVYYGGLLENAPCTLVSDILCANVNDNYFALDIPYSEHNIQTCYTFDQSKPGISQDFEVISTATGGAPNFAQNDTTQFTQSFRNYYSYDDGSAEAAYGTTGIQSRLAIQYTPYEADSILGLAMHFVPSVNDVSNNLFLLTVWDDNNGQPGNVIYEDNVFFPRTPSYNYGYNMFSYYFFEDTVRVPVNGTFYVGWRQFEAERLNIGLDRNIDNSDHTFFSIDGGATWEQATESGSVMIRPIFSTDMNVTLGVAEKPEIREISKIYPNPTKNKVTIEPAVTYTGAILRNMQGQIVKQIEETEFYMQDLPSGIYLLEIRGESKMHRICKM
ncbi:MAG: T9SS type A sorting domain-containing protein [bacterium]|nr:T9SS type A sorting domain-containing protein [bacterium]